MKRKHLLLAMGLGTIGIANAQTTTTNTYSSTTTNSTYATSPVTTDSTNDASTNSMNNSSMSNSNSMNNSSTNSMNSATNGTTNGTYSTNSTASPTYGTTTTTTTTTDYNSADRATRRADGDKGWGKEGKFGIYAGVNFSRFVNEPIPDGAYRAGWQAGLYGRSGGTVFGQIGLEYRNSTSNLVRRGTGQSTPTTGEVRGQIDQHFLAIPAYVGLRIGGTLGLRIQAGLELSSLFAVGSNNFGLNKDDLNRTILGGLGGVGINLGPLTLDAVYNVGLQNVFQNADTKRQLLAFNLGLRF